MQPTEVTLLPRSIASWQALLGQDRWAELLDFVELGRSVFAGRPLWCVNSTAGGGGVAEMLRTLLSYVRGAGVESRWAVIDGNPEFFAITKRIHNFIHGNPGDGGSLGGNEHEAYERAIAANVPGLLELIAPGMVVLLHDPQTAGLVRPLQEHGCTVVWRSHIGSDRRNEYVEAGWGFIERYVRDADGLVFTRRPFIPDIFADHPTAILQPSIDPFAPKNQELDTEVVRAILVSAGILAGAPAEAAPVFRRFSGEIGEVHRRAQLLDGGPPVDPEQPIVLQVSRWDSLKGHIGVMEGFVRRTLQIADADLLLAGPQDNSVTDDPEGTDVLADLLAEHRKLPERLRRRVHIASLPMDDQEENAAMVNALQRHATVVVQKSLEEGFGLTVTEAMWKERPLIASAVGGISDQVSDGRTGVLLADPFDLDTFGVAVANMLNEPLRARRLAVAGKANVRDHFLHDRHIRQYIELFGSMPFRGERESATA